MEQLRQDLISPAIHHSHTERKPTASALFLIIVSWYYLLVYEKMIVVSQKTLRNFNKQKRLSGTVASLSFIKKQSGLKDFYNFCKKTNDILPEQAWGGQVLFHGSPQKQTALVPHASIGRDGVAEQKTFVYATDDPNYAIFLASLRLNKFGGASVDASSKSTRLSVNLGFVNGQSKLTNGYVHIVSRKFFKETTNREYKTDKTINILFRIPVAPQDLTVPIYIQTE